MNFSSVINDSFQPYYPHRLLLLFLCYHFKHPKLLAVLDIFKLVENLDEGPLHLSEVYSRYLLFDQETSAKEAIDAYSLDK